MKKFFSVIILAIIVQVTLAQNITVENFRHHKHYIWQIQSLLPLDKKNAVLLFKTELKGFQFKTSKGNPIDFEETDEGVILKLPHKTKYVVISHPETGDYVWRVPEKYLKKHNYYTADLLATDLTKEYKNQKQWLVLNISPENSVVTIDSVMHRVNNGKLELYLPVGVYNYTAESPFYEPMSDSVDLSDKEKIERYIYLEPAYSYLTVKSEDDHSDIYIDEQLVGKGEATIGRMSEGSHRISILKGNKWVKDTVINVAAAEKKIVFMPINEMGYGTNVFNKFEKHPSPTVYRKQTFLEADPRDLIADLKNRKDTLNTALVHLIAEDSLSHIRIDREIVGQGEWSGYLTKGFHLIMTEKDGKESVAQYIDINDSSEREIKLVAPSSSLGMINIHSNISDVNVYLDGKQVGVTPCLIKNVKADEILTLVFKKEGYIEKKIEVRVKNNDIINIEVKLKAKK